MMMTMKLKSMLVAAMAVVALEAAALEPRIECAERGGWTIAGELADVDGGVCEYRVKMRSAEGARPPRFSVSFALPQGGAHNVWTAFMRRGGASGIRVDWEKLYDSNLAVSTPLVCAKDCADRNSLTVAAGEVLRDVSFGIRLREEGCEFRSHIDGSKHFFTPEKVIDIERSIGADIIMAFDECPPGTAPYDYAKKSLALTHHWLDRCIQRFNETEPKYGYHQSLYPIVQGCTYRDLRTESAEFVASKNAEGNAIGGLAVGEPAEVMYEMIELVNGILPKDRPRYLMGVGTPENILEAIALGVDQFDCVMPSRNGRNAMLFTSEGTLNMRNAKWATDFTPIDPNGTSPIDHQYTRAYLHHLYKAQELLALQLGTIHNLAFYMWLVREARKHIIEGDFRAWKDQMIPKLRQRL